MTLLITWRHRLRLPGVLAILLILSGLCGPVFSDPVKPSALDRKITRIISLLLQKEHLSKHPLDDEISQRCLKMFLDSLDPMKVYFYQSDIDSFVPHEKELDDLVRRGDLGFAYTVFQTFLQRIDERVKLVDEFLAVEHDFTIDEQILKDKDLAQYARNEAEAREKWRKRIKYDLLALKADRKMDKDDEKAKEDPVEKLRRRYHSFAKRMHQTDGEELLETYLTAMTMAFDPHTTYMSPSSYENFLIDIGHQLQGIGAALTSVDGYTVVKKIIPGGAADKDERLKPEDRIVGVGEGADGEIVDVVDVKLRDVVKMIRGDKGTVVRLEVTAGDSPERRIIQITRAVIELKDRDAQAAVFEEGRKPNGGPYKIGIIDLPSFYMDMEGARRGIPDFKSTSRDVRRILEDFDEKNVDAVILDLRRNGGGSLQEAINTTGLFIKDGPVVQVKDSDGNVLPYHDLDSGIVWKGPLVVLVSKFSASASEILAGAIQDYHRGLIVGDPSTHGKGTVQSLTDLARQLLQIPNAPQWGALKITMQQFYRPNGESTQKRGVLADIELPSLSAHYDVAEADLDYPMAFDQVKPLKFNKLSYVDQAVRDRLKHLSGQRQSESKDFKKVQRNIQLYLKQKEREYVTLNEAKFMKELEELNADKEEREAMEDLADSGELGIKRNYYLDEALAITVDYLQLVFVAKAH